VTTGSWWIWFSIVGVGVAATVLISGMGDSACCGVGVSQLLR